MIEKPHRLRPPQSPALKKAVKNLAARKFEGFVGKVQQSTPIDAEEFEFLNAVYTLNKAALSISSASKGSTVNMTDLYAHIIDANMSKTFVGSKKNAKSRIKDAIGKILNRHINTPAGEISIMAKGGISTGNQAGASHGLHQTNDGQIQLSDLPKKPRKIDSNAASTTTVFEAPTNDGLADAFRTFSDTDLETIQGFISDLRKSKCTIENGPLLFSAFRIMDDVYGAALKASGGVITDRAIYRSAITTTIFDIAQEYGSLGLNTEKIDAIFEAAERIEKSQGAPIATPIAGIRMGVGGQINMVQYNDDFPYLIQKQDNGIFAFVQKAAPAPTEKVKQFHGLNIQRLEEEIGISGKTHRKADQSHDTANGSFNGQSGAPITFQDRLSWFAPIAAEIGIKTGQETQFHAPPGWEIDDENHPGICIFTFPALRKHVFMSRRMGLAVLISNEDDRDPINDLQTMRYRDLHAEENTRVLPMGNKSQENFLKELKHEVETDFKTLGKQSKTSRARWIDNPSAAAVLLQALVSIEGFKTSQKNRTTAFKTLFSQAGKPLPDEALDFKNATLQALDSYLKRSHKIATDARPTSERKDYGPTKAFEERKVPKEVWNLVDALQHYRVA